MSKKTLVWKIGFRRGRGHMSCPAVHFNLSPRRSSGYMCLGRFLFSHPNHFNPFHSESPKSPPTWTSWPSSCGTQIFLAFEASLQLYNVTLTATAIGTPEPPVQPFFWSGLGWMAVFEIPYNPKRIAHHRVGGYATGIIGSLFELFFSFKEGWDFKELWLPGGDWLTPVGQRLWVAFLAYDF